MRLRIVALAVFLVSAAASAQVPVANAGPDQNVFVGALVHLNGSGSTDPGGLPLTYAWSLTTRPGGSAAVLSSLTAVNPTFVADVAGTYVAQLIVNNGSANSAPDTVTVTAAVSVPVANAGPDQNVFVGGLVHLNGSGSTDPGGSPLTYAWSLTTRPGGSAAVLSSPTAVNPTFVADVAGVYVAQLIVNNGTTNSAPDTVTITAAVSVPVANAGPDQNVFVGALVHLNGSGSTDPGGSPLTYAWSLTTRPGGSAAVLSSLNAVNPTFTADVAGTYVAQLIVNNGVTSSAPDTVTITAAVSVPVANAGPDQNVGIGALVHLVGSASTDPGGAPLTYAWSLTTKPGGSAAVLSIPTTVNPTFVADVGGTYVAQLIVNNGVTSSAPDTVTITSGVTATPSPSGIPTLGNWGMLATTLLLAFVGLLLLRHEN